MSGCCSRPRNGAGKKIKGRNKRHIVTDTIGLMVGLVVHADIQDRDGAPAVLRVILKRWPWLRHIFVDGRCAGQS